MSEIILSRAGIKEFRRLLNETMMTRVELVDHLSRLEYVRTPQAEAQADATGYVPLGPRVVELADLVVPLPVAERLAAVTRDHRLSSARCRESTQEINARAALALEAILTGVLAPQRPEDLTPHIPFKHRGSKYPTFTISDYARLGLERLCPPSPATREAMKHGHHPKWRPRFSYVIAHLSRYRFHWIEGVSAETPPAVHKKEPFMSLVPAHTIEHFAEEGRRLGIPPSRGGRRTALAMCSATLEALGQGLLVPYEIATRETGD